MNHAYNSSASSSAYEQFLASPNGQIFRNVIGKAFLDILTALPTANAHTNILDAGCGDGWLAGLIAKSHLGNEAVKVHACDAGEPLITSAKTRYSDVEFTVCDLNTPLPYQKSYFDVVTASMVIHDVEDEVATLQNIFSVLKPGGKLLATIVNPYYAYPIGEWKRGITGRLLMKKPKLLLARFYNEMMRKNRPSFEWRPNLGSHFTPLSTHISNAKKAGFALTALEDIQSTTDSANYDLVYQLHRFPIILLLEFTKQ